MPATVFKQVFQFTPEFLSLHPRLGSPDEVYEIDEQDKHGREMAAIAWAMTGGSRADAPEFVLVNAKGMLNLNRAVQYCIDQKVDIILFSQNYEYGGNFDGRGFINAAVNRALSAGIIWINAAGNYGGRVFNAPVKLAAGKTVSGDDAWLDLNGKHSLRLLSRYDDNPVRIILSWNAFTDDRTAGTDKDLDLFLYDEFGAEVASSVKKQVLRPDPKVVMKKVALKPGEMGPMPLDTTPPLTPPAGMPQDPNAPAVAAAPAPNAVAISPVAAQPPPQPVEKEIAAVVTPEIDEAGGESDLAREIIATSLQKNHGGHYTIRVKAKSGQFVSLDKLRIVVMPTNSPTFDAKIGRLVDPVELVDATSGQEVMTPADNPGVIAVGEPSYMSAKGPTMDGRSKPDVYVQTSNVEFTTGHSSYGTSNAAAMFAGIVATMKALRPTLTREEILSFVKEEYPSEMTRGEARGVIDLGVGTVRDMHPVVFDAIESRFKQGLGAGGSPIVLAGRYRQDGPYVAALDRSPSVMSKYWSNVPRDAGVADGYEIYLRTISGPKGSDAYAYVRPRQRSANAVAQAWEKELDSNPGEFVQVIQGRALQYPKNEKKAPYWKTPTPAQLRALSQPN